jgi:transcriptional regulator with XRE-family HTH domain
MFDMLSVGRKIASLRKDKNMTQVELADLLGISYQAVSNWERGDSMPDIAKLVDLSKIFEISIDELLGNGKESEVIKQIIDDEPIQPDKLDKETLRFILPIMKPSKIKETFKNLENLKFKELLELVPFLETEEVDALVLKLYQEDPTISIVAFAPFMSQDAISSIVKKHVDKNDPFELDHLAALAPFISRDVLDQVAIQLYQQKGTKKIVPLAPFISKEVIKEIVDKEIEEGNYHKVIALMPFAGKGFDKSFFKSFKKAFQKEDEE